MKRYRIVSILLILFLFSTFIPSKSTGGHSETPSDAEQLNLGTNQISLTPENQINFNYYYFEPQVNQFYRIELEVLTPEINAEMTVYDANGTLLDHAFSEFNDYENSSVYVIDQDATGNFSISVFISDKTNVVREFSITIVEVFTPDAYLPSDPITIELDEPQTLKILPDTASYLEINIPYINPYAISLSSIDEVNTTGITFSAFTNSTYLHDPIKIPNNSTGYFIPAVSGLQNISIMGNFVGEISVEIFQQIPPDGYSIDYPLSVGDGLVTNLFYPTQLYVVPTVEYGSAYFLNYQIDPSSIFTTSVHILNETSGEKLTSLYDATPRGNLYFYLEEEIIIEFEVETFDGQYDSVINLEFEPTDTISHSNRDTGENIDIGSNLRFTEHQLQQYWFKFTATSSQLYGVDLDTISWSGSVEFDIFSQSGDIIGNGNTRSSVPINLISGQTIFIRVMCSQPKNFNLQIHEGEPPGDISEYVYSRNLQYGDHFSWHIDSQINGAPVSKNNPEFPFPDGSTIALEVLEGAPVLNLNEERFSDYFSIMIDSQMTQIEPSRFLSPVEILIDGYSLASGIDVLRNNYFIDLPLEFVEDEGNIIATSVYNGYSEDVYFFAVFNPKTFYLEKLELNIREGFSKLFLKFTLNNLEVSGPSSTNEVENNDELEENEPVFNVSFPPSPIVVSMMAMMIIYVKKR